MRIFPILILVAALNVVGLQDAAAQGTATAEAAGTESERETGALMASDAFIDLPSIDQPVAQTDQGARDLAIVIAVEQYHNLTNVAGAEITGLDWKSFFSGHLGIEEDRILFLTNARAIPSIIERETEQHLEKAHEDGRVWFVFIGHGAPDPTEHDPEPLLVGAGAINHTAEDFRLGAIPKSKIEELLTAGRQKQTIMVLDTCFSGQTEYGQSLTGTQAVVPDLSRLQPQLAPRDIVFSAARHDEAAHSLPGPTVDRPAFSYALLGALRGWADTTGDGVVTAEEAERYVRRTLVGMQTPSLVADDPSVRGAALVTQAIEEEPGFASTIQGLINRGQAFAQGGPCEVEGQVRNMDTQGQCCWPGQAYSSQMGSCLGSPICPDGMVLGDDAECRQAEEGEFAYAESTPSGECQTGVRCRQMGEDAFRGRGGTRDFEKAAQLFARGCELGDMRSCSGLGFRYNRGLGVERDPQRATQLYEKACEGGSLRGCANLAVSYQRGDDRPKDLRRAYELYDRACAGGEMLGCTNLGVLYRDGRGVSKDERRAVELFSKSCEEGFMFGCAFLGDHYAFTDSAGQSWSRAAELYDQACRGGEWRGCRNLARRYANGEGVDEDMTRAVELWDQACQMGSARGCNDLGYRYENGDGVEQSYRRAAELYDLACQRGDMWGCNNLGIRYANGQGVEQDWSRANELYKEACDGGNSYACNNLGRNYAEGRGVEQDRSRAVRLYRKACEEDVLRACSELGFHYASGDGVARNLTRARELQEMACEGGDMVACRLLGNIYIVGQGVPQDWPRAYELHKKACEGGDMVGCSSVGFSYTYARGTQHNVSRGIKLMKRGCEGGDGFGCFNLAQLYSRNEKISEAAKFYEKACMVESPNGEGCNGAGRRYFLGEGVEKDLDRAIELFKKACKHGSMWGCHNLGLQFNEGTGIRQDKRRARELFERACQGGIENACEALEGLD